MSSNEIVKKAMGGGFNTRFEAAQVRAVREVIKEGQMAKVEMSVITDVAEHAINKLLYLHDYAMRQTDEDPVRAMVVGRIFAGAVRQVEGIQNSLYTGGI